MYDPQYLTFRAVSHLRDARVGKQFGLWNFTWMRRYPCIARAQNQRTGFGTRSSVDSAAGKLGLDSTIVVIAQLLQRED